MTPHISPMPRTKWTSVPCIPVWALAIAAMQTPIWPQALGTKSDQASPHDHFATRGESRELTPPAFDLTYHGPFLGVFCFLFVTY